MQYFSNLWSEISSSFYKSVIKEKGNTELLNEINKVLERLKTEGKIEEYTINHCK